MFRFAASASATGPLSSDSSAISFTLRSFELHAHLAQGVMERTDSKPRRGKGHAVVVLDVSRFDRPAASDGAASGATRDRSAGDRGRPLHPTAALQDALFAR
jgi:hypothetical protein